MQTPDPTPDEATATPARAAALWLEAFGQALAAQDTERAAGLFERDAFWRDLLAFTWNFKTVEGRARIHELLRDNLARTAPDHWDLDGAVTERDGVIEAWFRFETRTGRGVGHLRLRDGRAWTLFTALRELRGHEEKTGRRRWIGTDHHYGPGRRTWLEMRQARSAAMGHALQPWCLVVGGGQGGIALAARLRRLDVPTLVIDRHARAGDAWRHRYKSLCLHDPVWYDHLPYLPFPDDWPVYTPKDKLGDWLEAYVKLMELDHWPSTECLGARYDDAAQRWEVRVRRGDETLVLRPTQLVFALGVSGYPNVPQLPGRERFRGRQHHASAHPGGEGWRGKRCVVLGSNNSAHDICADLWEHGAQVTMLQRSSTLVVKSATLLERVTGRLYSEQALEAGITTERADLMNACTPFRLAHRLGVKVWEEIARADAPFYDRLRAAGFRLDFADDGAGLHAKYLRRGAGYYIDVGASELIASGAIALRSGVEIASIVEDGVRLTNGEHLPADLIVYATGYGSMTEWVADLISPEVADRVGRCWGLGSGTPGDPGPWEGELRNLWKPTQQPGLWFHGGNLAQSRHYSLYLALQLKARFEGLETPVWGMETVHHRR